MTKKVDFGMQGDSLEVEDGGVVQVKSGGRVFLASGAVIHLATGADILVAGDSLIDEIAALTGLSLGEITVIDSVTAGVGAVSKAMVLNASGNFTMPDGGYFDFSVAALAAAGSGQATYAVIADQIVAVTGADGTKGAALPATSAGRAVFVINAHLTNALPIAPINSGNDAINSLTAGTGVFTMAPATAAWFIPTSATQWYVPDNAAQSFAPAAASLTSSGVGAKVGATVTVVEQGNGVDHKTIFTLTATPITLTDDAGVGQYGGVKFYDMPAGNHHFIGAVVDADLTLNETWWTDAAEGDVGLGTTAVTDGNALATTEQNIIATTAIAALVAQVGAINAGSSAAATVAAAGAADTDLYLNVRIDDSAAHMPDAVTNGAFGSDTAWTKGTGWTIAAGVATSDGTQEAVSDLSQNISAVNGVSYSVTYTVTRTAGTIQPYLGGTAGTVRSTTNTFTETIVAGADGILLFRADADFVGTLDNVTATPLTGTGTITGTVTVAWINLGDF